MEKENLLKKLEINESLNEDELIRRLKVRMMIVRHEMNKHLNVTYLITANFGEPPINKPR